MYRMMTHSRITQLKVLLKKQGIYTFLVILFISSSILSPAFSNPQNLRDILNQAAALGMVSIGQTLVILLGHGCLDLSVASVMATAAVIAAKNTEGQNALLLPVAMICVLFGMLVGLANGLLITKRRVQPFMATIGMMIIVQGLRFMYTKGAPKGDFPPLLRFLGTGKIGPFPMSIISLAILAGVAAIVLKKTILGRQIYVIGGNSRAGNLSGYSVHLIVIVTYMISGFTAAIAGLYLGGWLGTSDNWIGKGYDLNSVAAVAIGGTSLQEGGRGGIWGTLAGVLIIMMLYNIVLLLHLPVQAQYIVKGGVIIFAAYFYVRKVIR